MAGCALLGCAPAAATGGGTPTPLDIEDLAAPAFSVYTSEDGLSDEIWRTVGFDRRGFVWAGSASELARFDGYRWVRWPFPEARSLVRDLHLDERGVLWAVFEREGLARLDGDHWRLEPGLDGPFLGFWTSDGGRVVWSVGGGGLWRLDGDRWRPDGGTLGSDESPGGNAFAQTETVSGGPRQWMGSLEGGLLVREVDAEGDPAGPWRPFDAELLAEGFVQDLVRTTSEGLEELWLVSYGGGLVRIRSDGVRTWRSSTGELPTEAIYGAVTTTSSDGKRILWVASRAGLLRVVDDEVAVFDRRHGLPSDAVREVRVQPQPDGTDVLWLATEGGIARAVLRESPWQTASLLGARSNGTFAVLVEPDERGSERLWVGTAMEGLALLEAGDWRVFRAEDGTLPTRGVRGVFRLPGQDGRPWRLLSLYGGLLLQVDEDLSFHRLETPWPQSAEGAVTSALATADGARHIYWFATNHDGVHRWRPDGGWSRSVVEGVGDSWRVLHLAQQVDRAGRSWLWAAGPQGLARFDGRRWSLLGAEDQVPGGGYRHTALVAEGDRTVLWASSDRNGVVRLDVTEPGDLRQASGPAPPPAPDPTVYSVLPDSGGSLWVCTNNGVQRLVPRANREWTETVFRRPDGILHDECNTGAQLVDAHDRYWLGTLGGLSVFTPGRTGGEAEPVPKALHFTELRVDGKGISARAGDEIRVAPGARELTLSYTLIAGQREFESTYRTQLIGFESQFGSWTNEHRRSFSGLSPGDYRFRVEGRDWTGTASAPAELTLVVEPQWWQRRSVQGSLLLAFTFLGFGALHRRDRALRVRQRELEFEVATRTSELRTANQELTKQSYRDPLTGIPNRRRLLEATDAAVAHAVRRRQSMAVLVADIDHFKSYNDCFGHLVGDVALRAVAQTLFESCREQDLVARFGGEEFVCLLPSTDRETAAVMAERFRARVESLEPRRLGNDHQGLTISVGGLVRVPSGQDERADFLELADRALYEAKRQGRNRVVFAG